MPLLPNFGNCFFFDTIFNVPKILTMSVVYIDTGTIWKKEGLLPVVDPGDITADIGFQLLQRLLFCGVGLTEPEEFFALGIVPRHFGLQSFRDGFAPGCGGSACRFFHDLRFPIS
jgi:hypothetical protein